MYKNLIKLIDQQLLKQKNDRLDSFRNWIINIEYIKEIDNLETVLQDILQINVTYSMCRSFYQLESDGETVIIINNQIDVDEIKVVLVYIIAMVLFCPNDVKNAYNYFTIVCENKVLIIPEHRLVMKFILEFLMPKSVVICFVRLKNQEKKLPPNKLVKAVAAKFNVTKYVSRKRLVSLGIID